MLCLRCAFRLLLITTTQIGRSFLPRLSVLILPFFLLFFFSVVCFFFLERWSLHVVTLREETTQSWGLVFKRGFPNFSSLSARFLPLSQGWGHAGGLQGLAGAFWGVDPAEPLPPAPAREVLR